MSRRTLRARQGEDSPRNSRVRRFDSRRSRACQGENGARHLQNGARLRRDGPDVKQAFIATHQAISLTRAICLLLGVSASGHYDWFSRALSRRSAQNARLSGRVVDERNDDPKTGERRSADGVVAPREALGTAAPFRSREASTSARPRLQPEVVAAPSQAPRIA
jgi:hypothetical protein